MRHFSSLVALFTISLSGVAFAGRSCVAFDATWNLLVFGLSGKDYNAGTQDTWAQGTATDITTSGRPPFNGANTNCYLSQFANAIYVLGADSSNPSSIYIYDAAAKLWSTQSVNTNGFDPTSFSAILDRDTNVFYALSKGELFSLDMALLKAANSAALSWADVQKPSFNTDNYQPVMVLAENHIHFLNVPGVAAGSADIFVIHFSFLQPEPQSYGKFPATHGQATSFFKDGKVQEEFAFIPDDGSATYVVNVVTNSTQTLLGPDVNDPMSTYFGSIDALVQLSSSGLVSYLPYNADTASTNSAASWSPVNKLSSLASPATPGGSTAHTSVGSTSNTAKGAAATGPSAAGSNGALLLAPVVWTMGGAVLFGVAASLL